MKRINFLLAIIAFLFVLTHVNAQVLKMGFDAQEYCNMLGISSRQGDSATWVNMRTPLPAGYKLTYRSPAMAMDNRWDLWTGEGKTPVISIRGTTIEQKSWLENFYAAMVPATGSIKLSDTETFTYKFAADSNAYVHTGWTIGLGTIWNDILTKVKDLYAKGERNMLIMGHSQGGAIAYLLHSQLYYMQQSGQLPADLVFKTYCSAPPKPGNLYYAYDFDFITRKGSAFRVVNAQDWVTESPISIETTDDLNKLNPLVNAKASIKKMPFAQRLAVNYVSNRLKKAPKKASKTFRKYVGKRSFPFVKKNMPGLQQPVYAPSLNYMTAGIPIILQPNTAYSELVGKNPGAFTHHSLFGYYFLVKEYYLK